MKFLLLWLAATAFLMTALSAEAQQSLNVPRIGVLSPLTPAVAAANHQAFLRGLRELGYVDGKNILIEYRFSEGRPTGRPL
jgi:putative tryptophan/tyrosine transport system substrate-binding protein